MTTSQSHELVREFRNHHFRLNKTLEDMLNEHYSHQTERRGCGYTQATRHLAEYINRPRTPDSSNDLRLFRDGESIALLASTAESFAAHESCSSIRHQLNDAQQTTAPIKTDHSVRHRIKPVFELFRRDSTSPWQTRLQKIPRLVKQEESRVLAQMIVDIVAPMSHIGKDTVALPTYPEKLAIGSCPLAEKYFLELAHKHVKRQGLMNIIVDDDGRPLIIEKMNLGDNHSCLSLVTLTMNGVRLPPGSLLGLAYDSRALQKTRRKVIPGCQIRLADCDGFRFLRLTTLAITPANRARAFTTHFEAQQANGLFAPESTQLAQLTQIAQAELNYAHLFTEQTSMFSKNRFTIDNALST